MLIGRKEEKRRLIDAYEADTSQFVAVYGRRRIGKTFLIRETFNYNFTFTHTGLNNANKEEQIIHFCNSLKNAGFSKINDKDFTPPSTWLQAFYLLEDFIIELPKEGKKVIFIDELSWMDTHKSGIITALEGFWNGFASGRKDILLIVCASSTSWIIDNVIHNKGGLHNRLNYNIKLGQFKLQECKEFIQSKNISLTDNQIIECYMIMGGVPYYWSLLDKQYSLYQNIDRIFFAENSLLQNEFEYLYASLFTNPEVYIKLITAFGKKKVGLTREELIEATNVSNNSALTNRLQDLENCGFIRSYKRFGSNNKNVYYQLIDNFTLFYFKFLEHNPKDEHFWENQINVPAINIWNGLAFERVCLEHIPQIKKKLGISGVLTEVCSWSCKEDENIGLMGSQIDLLIVRRDQVINLCEIKYSNKPYTITKSVNQNIINKVDDLYLATGTKYAIHKTMITPQGLVRNAYSDSITSQITGEDLFQ